MKKRVSRTLIASTVAGISVMSGLVLAQNTASQGSQAGTASTSSGMPGMSGTSSSAGGAGDGAAPATTPTSTGQPAQVTQRQVYIAQLNPANPSVSNASGTARIVVEDSQVGIYIQAVNLDTGMQHQQHIHPGAVCPGTSADTNGDGIVDDAEGEKVSGPPLVPFSVNLTQDLSTLGNSAGAASTLSSLLYPTPSSDGVYNYIASAPLSDFQKLLSSSAGTSPAPSPSATSSPGATPTPLSTPTPTPSASAGTSAGNLSFAGHTIEIHGVSSSANLPSTVQSADPAVSPATALPVACGSIVQINE